MLGRADRERLRALVASLGGEVRASLTEATPKAYASAATLVSELLELRLIEVSIGLDPCCLRAALLAPRSSLLAPVESKR